VNEFSLASRIFRADFVGRCEASELSTGFKLKSAIPSCGPSSSSKPDGMLS
jgi:hypothetical protein